VPQDALGGGRVEAAAWLAALASASALPRRRFASFDAGRLSWAELNASRGEIVVCDLPERQRSGPRSAEIASHAAGLPSK